MIDLHCHILPELDDGARNVYVSLDMARLAAESGVAGIVATPHCAGNRSREVKRAFSFLRDAIKEANIPVELFLGMEIFGTGDTAQMLSEGKLLTVNGSSYPLIEFDFDADGEMVTKILRDVANAGYRPIVAHPERYEFVRHEPELINIWHDMGCLLQINRGSYFGRFGAAAQKLAYALTQRGFTFAVSSDAHSASVRTTWMKDVRDILVKEFSEDTAERLLLRNAMMVLKNERIPSATPIWF